MLGIPCWMLGIPWGTTRKVVCISCRKEARKGMVDKYHRDEPVTSHQYWSTMKMNLKNLSSHENPVKISIYKVPYLIFARNRLPTPFLSFQKHGGGGPETPRLTKGVFNEASTSVQSDTSWDLASWANNDPQWISMQIHLYLSRDGYTFIHSSIHPFMQSCLCTVLSSCIHSYEIDRQDRIDRIDTVRLDKIQDGIRLNKARWGYIHSIM